MSGVRYDGQACSEAGCDVLSRRMARNSYWAQRYDADAAAEVAQSVNRERKVLEYILISFGNRLKGIFFFFLANCLS